MKRECASTCLTAEAWVLVVRHACPCAIVSRFLGWFSSAPESLHSYSTPWRRSTTATQTNTLTNNSPWLLSQAAGSLYSTITGCTWSCSRGSGLAVMTLACSRASSVNGEVSVTVTRPVIRVRSRHGKPPHTRSLAATVWPPATQPAKQLPASDFTAQRPPVYMKLIRDQSSAYQRATCAAARQQQQQQQPGWAPYLDRSLPFALKYKQNIYLIPLEQDSCVHLIIKHRV